MGKLIDLIGKNFGYLTVIERDFEYQKIHNNKVPYWRCKCKCGNIVTISGANLRNGHTKSCGCFQKEQTSKAKTKDLTGKVFGYLTVIEREPVLEKESLREGARWRCKCKCGIEKIIHSAELINGKTKSCGCLYKERGQEKINDLVGKRYGKLVVEGLAYSSQGKLYWKCKCDCGNYKNVKGDNLKLGFTSSCGCLTSKGENIIAEILKNNNIVFEQQKTFSTCYFSKKQALCRFDFYINNSFLLEFDGEQHYKVGNGGIWNNKENFEKTRKRDEYKNQWCRENNIPLKRIPYWELNNITIENIMDNTFLIS